MKYVIAGAVLGFMAWLICKFVAFGAKDDVHRCIHTKDDCVSCPRAGNCIHTQMDCESCVQCEDL